VRKISIWNRASSLWRWSSKGSSSDSSSWRIK